MSYCFNPACEKPRNPDGAKFCQNCGLELLLSTEDALPERCYRALELIGQGGFGRTFLAVDEAKPEKLRCVIKQALPCNQGSLTAQKSIALFRQEVDWLDQLGQHPQIPRLLDYFMCGNRQYLVQEFINGQNLTDRLVEQGPFRADSIYKLLNDVLPVLRYIHGHQVIHRDIKPENIICPARGDRLVLVDFGASKHATETALARTGTVIGSAGYVAPEQAMGRAEFASDLYSLGVTCAHLLTAMHPFDLYSVSEDAWVWHQYLPEPVSDELQRVLDKLLQRPTRLRYQTATAVLRDLSHEPKVVRLTRNLPLTATPVKVLPVALKQGDTPTDSAQDWTCLHTLLGHQGPVTAIATRSEGQLLASSSTDKTIKLWNLNTGKVQHTYAGRSLWFGSGHTDRISAIAFIPDQQRLISGSDDGKIKLWDLITKKLVMTLPEHEWDISVLAVSLNGRVLASGGGDGVIHLWDLEAEELIGRLTKHRDRVSGMVISPDGQTLASSSYDKTIRLWDLKTNRLINTLMGHGEPVSAIAITPDWRTLVSSSWDRTLKLWDLRSGRQLQVLMGHSDRINCVTMSPDGQTLASGSEDGTIKLWNLEGDRATPQERPKFLRHSWGINALSFSPDGQTLVSGSTDETVKIWHRCRDRI